MTTVPDVPSFPRGPDERPTFDTWREPPHNRRSYQRMREIVPTARVASAADPSELRPGGAVGLDRVVVGHPDGREETASGVLDRTFTDGFLLLRDDEIVVETSPGGMPADRPHMLLSLSKQVSRGLCRGRTRRSRARRRGCTHHNGQLVVVDVDGGTVAVKLSSWPLPQDPAMLSDTLRMIDAVGSAAQR